MRSLTLRALHEAYRLSLAGARRRFERAARDPERAQGARLRALLASGASSAYGRVHGFDRIRSVREWQSRVPAVGYDELEPWVQRAAAGEPGVLTRAPVRAFETTSGSTGADKLVPITDALLAEFGAATGPWLHDLYTRMPALRGTTSYWSISPAARRPRRTPGGVPIGFDSDTEYFQGLARAVLRRSLAVPPEVAAAGDLDAWAAATVRHLAGAGDLGLVSVWHPSFFALLLDRLEAELDAVLDGLPPGRAREVRSRLAAGHALGRSLWPRLALVSCWADGTAADGVAPLRARLPQARFQPKGLLATEGVVSLPLLRDGASRSVAAVAGHFLEFVDLDRRGAPPRLAHELRAGGCYAPLLSTGGGFYRYRLGDAVRCEGFYGHAPCLRFEGRLDQVSDLCGEKLSAGWVGTALERVRSETDAAPAFVLVAPGTGDPPRYRLYAEGLEPARLARFAERLDRTLSESHGYGYARALGQLAALEPVAVTEGATRYIRACADRGQRPGDVKPTCFDARPGWSEVFAP